MSDGAGGDLVRAIREQAPRVLAAVTRRAGDFALAEDAVQEALLAAAEQWPREGTPANPGGWLYQVACRRLADTLDAAAARARREAEVAAGRAEAREADDTLPDEARDETLELFFLCCHPALEDAQAVALVLRALGGLTTAEIARAFFVPEATMAQRIHRAKQALRASKVPFPAQEPGKRLTPVLHVLYLVFNEGYLASSGADLVRVDLSAEAIRLARLVHAEAPDDPEAAGLLALLLLTDARRAARTGPRGELVPLHEQDRRLWDRAAIREGTELVTAAIARGTVGSYQVQAAIASLHDEASSLESTDWPQILALYGLLARFADNPAVALNRAVALAMVHGPAAGLAALAALDADPRLAASHRLDAVRGHLLERAGDRPAALRHYRAAAERAPNRAERRYLEAKAAELEELESR
jgi:RNA polymerase sigma factor (sigma-70 family)